MLTARQYAQQKGINYRTALNWLAAGLVPGAEVKTSPLGDYWEVPSTALTMEKPKPGPKPNTVKAVKLKAVKQSRKKGD